MSELLTLFESARALRVSRSMVLKLINGDPAKGKPPALPSVRIGRRVFVRPGAITRFIEASESKPGVKSAA